jgi:hypothetical protein
MAKEEGGRARFFERGVSRERMCPICGKEIAFAECLDVEDGIKVEVLERAWRSPSLKIPCCICFDLLNGLGAARGKEDAEDREEGPSAVATYLVCELTRSAAVAGTVRTVLEKLGEYGLVEKDDLESARSYLLAGGQSRHFTLS